MAELGIEVNGMKFPNPFVLASGPPGTNAKVIKRSFALSLLEPTASSMCLSNGSRSAGSSRAM